MLRDDGGSLLCLDYDDFGGKNINGIVCYTLYAGRLKIHRSLEYLRKKKKASRLQAACYVSP